MIIAAAHQPLLNATRHPQRAVALMQAHLLQAGRSGDRARFTWRPAVGQVVTALSSLWWSLRLFPLPSAPSWRNCDVLHPAYLVGGCHACLALAADALFRPDVEDGVMEQWVLSGQPLAVAVARQDGSALAIDGLPLVFVW